MQGESGNEAILTLIKFGQSRLNVHCCCIVCRLHGWRCLFQWRTDKQAPRLASEGVCTHVKFTLVLQASNKKLNSWEFQHAVSIPSPPHTHTHRYLLDPVHL